MSKYFTREYLFDLICKSPLGVMRPCPVATGLGVRLRSCFDLFSIYSIYAAFLALSNISVSIIELVSPLFR